MVAEALPPGCGGSAHFLQKQSQLLVLGLEFDKKHVILEFDLGPSVAIEKVSNYNSSKFSYYLAYSIDQNVDFINISPLQPVWWGFRLRRLCHWLRRLCHPVAEALPIFCKNKVNS